MGTLIIIVLVVAGIFGLVALIASNKGDPKERATEAAGAALGGAVFAGSCIFQLILTALGLIIGLWFLSLIFGH